MNNYFIKNKKKSLTYPYLIRLTEMKLFTSYTLEN